jgi:hypothetical protein
LSWALVCGAERPVLGCFDSGGGVSALAEVDSAFFAAPGPLLLPEVAGAASRAGVGAAVSFLLGFRGDTGVDRLALVGVAALGLAAGTTFGRLLDSRGATGVDGLAVVGVAALGLAAGTTFGRFSEARGNRAEGLAGSVCSTASGGVANSSEAPPTERAPASVDVATVRVGGSRGVVDVIGSSAPARAGVNVTGKASAAPWPTGDRSSVAVWTGPNQSRLAGVGPTPGSTDQVETACSKVAEATAVAATSVPVRTSRTMSRSGLGTVTVPARHTTTRCAARTDSAAGTLAGVGVDRPVDTLRRPAETRLTGSSSAVGGCRLGHHGDGTTPRPVPAAGAGPIVSAIAPVSRSDAGAVKSAGDRPPRTTGPPPSPARPGQVSR